jgi:hypothetical protein
VVGFFVFVVVNYDIEDMSLSCKCSLVLLVFIRQYPKNIVSFSLYHRVEIRING